MIKTRVNVKPFGEEISQKFDHLHIHGLNLLKFAFSIFNLNFLNIHQKNKEFFDKKTRSNFKLCDKDIIPKFDRLIISYSFRAVLNQMISALLRLITHNTIFFTVTTKPFGSGSWRASVCSRTGRALCYSPHK
jgi:hypothetical protein